MMTFNGEKCSIFELQQDSFDLRSLQRRPLYVARQSGKWVCTYALCYYATYNLLWCSSWTLNALWLEKRIETF